MFFAFVFFDFFKHDFPDIPHLLLGVINKFIKNNFYITNIDYNYFLVHNLNNLNKRNI